MSKLHLDDLAVASFSPSPDGGHDDEIAAVSAHTDIRVCPVSYAYNCNPTFDRCFQTSGAYGC